MMRKKTSGRKEEEKISLKVIRHVADVVRLNLRDEELKKFQHDLNDILIAFKILDEAKARCKPSFQALEIRDVVREDTVEVSWSQKKALSATQHREKGFFKGPKAV